MFPKIRPERQQRRGVREARETHDVSCSPEVVAALYNRGGPVLDVSAYEKEKPDDELLVAKLEDELSEDGDPELSGVGDGVWGELFEKIGLIARV